MQNGVIPIPSIGTILTEEFLEPMGITAYRLAKDIQVPTSRILEILHGKRALSIDTALRLSHYFGMSDRYFIDLQTDLEITRHKNEKAQEIDSLPTIAVKQNDSPTPVACS